MDWIQKINNFKFVESTERKPYMFYIVFDFTMAVIMLLVIGKNEDCVGSIGGIICGVQLIPLIGSILPTEIALKKNFDKNGTRR